MQFFLVADDYQGIFTRNSLKFRPILDEEIPQSSIASCGL
jgi:hypothetical protein